MKGYVVTKECNLCPILLECADDAAISSKFIFACTTYGDMVGGMGRRHANWGFLKKLFAWYAVNWNSHLIQFCFYQFPSDLFLETLKRYGLGEILILNFTGWFQSNLEFVEQYGLGEFLILNFKGLFQSKLVIIEQYGLGENLISIPSRMSV